MGLFLIEHRHRLDETKIPVKLFVVWLYEKAKIESWTWTERKCILTFFYNIYFLMKNEDIDVKNKNVFYQYDQVLNDNSIFFIY